MNMEYPDVLEKILVFLMTADLYNLMQTCRTIRDIVGKSDVWKYLPKNKVIACKDNTKIKEIFEIFVSIRLSKRTFAIQDYYGDWYYLYIMYTWFGPDYRTNWNLYSLLKYPQDIEKLLKICEFVLEYDKNHRDWTLMIPKLIKKLVISSPVWTIKDMFKVLKSIYIMPYFYDQNDRFGAIIITNTKIKSNSGYPGFIWYPIESTNGTIAPEHFYYEFIIEYFRDDGFCSFSKNGSKFCNISSNVFLKKIQDISVELDVSYETLSDIVRIVLGKTISQCEQQINEFM